MNILTDSLPDAVMVDGVVYPVNTSFKVCLRIMAACEDNELTNGEKATVMLRLLYGENIPANTEEALRMASKFLDGGDQERGKGKAEAANEGRLYSFVHDASYIFSAFKQSHDIDLEQEEQLHWWKFLTLFFDLNPDCFFHRLINLRRNLYRGKLTKEERELYLSIKHIVDLPVSSSEADREEDEFLRLLREGVEKRASTV